MMCVYYYPWIICLLDLTQIDKSRLPHMVLLRAVIHPRDVTDLERDAIPTQCFIRDS